MTEQSTRSKIVTRRTYNRPKDDSGKLFESWADTVDRVIEHQRWLWERAKKTFLNAKELEELEELRQLMLERKALTSGRTLWLGGTAVSKKRESSQFNCSFLEVQTVHDVVDAYWLLLQGCGVGFRAVNGTLNGFTKSAKIEVVRSTRTVEDWEQGRKGRETNKESFHYDDNGEMVYTLSVGDSAESWAKALGKILAMKHAVGKIVIDFSEVRAAGIRLKGYGWISSGDETLHIAFKEICNILNRQAGQLLSKMDIHDIMNWIGTTLSSRRSAEISLMDVDDPEILDFALCKKNHWEGNPQRAQSNNTVVFYTKPSKLELRGMFDLMREGGGSEPGFANGEEALRRAPWWKGGNPCLTGDTLVQTSEGHFQIKDLVGKTSTIWDGERWTEVDNFRVTGHDQQITKVTLHDGSEIYATPYHRFILDGGTEVLLKDLKIGQKLLISDSKATHGSLSVAGAYLKGFLLGDGSLTHEDGVPLLQLYEPKHGCAAALVESAEEISPREKQITNTVSKLEFVETSVEGRMRLTGLAARKEELIPWCRSYKSGLPKEVFAWSLQSKLDFLAGLFDADGTASDTSNGFLYQIVAVNKQLLLDIQSLLKTIGVFSKLSVAGKGGLTDFGESRGGVCETQPSFRLTLSQQAAISFSSQVDFSRLVSFRDRKMAYNLKPKFNRVVGIEEAGVADKVYCCTVPTTTRFGLTSGVVTGNCFEILLGNKSFCNLIEDNCSAFNGNFEGLLQAHYIISRANYRQTCVNLDDGILQRTWHELNEFLRLTGAGITGIVGWEHHKSPEHLEKLKKAALDGVHSMADQLGLPRSKLTTTIKPSGTLSKVQDCTEGCHKPLGRYIFNNINLSKHDPLVDILTKADYKVVDNPYDPTSCLATIPVSYDEVEFEEVEKDGEVLYVNLESAIDQLERYKLLMKHYVQHNASVTVSYSPEEVPEIVDWLYENWDHYVGVSFLYRNDPTKTAADLGYPYLPQEVVSKSVYDEYVASLKDIDLDAANSFDELEDDECAGGACPVR